MLFGQEGISGRGFEVSYQEGEPAAYEVRVFTPSTERDWLGAMEFMSKLAIYLQVDIIDEEGMEYKANHITLVILWRANSNMRISLLLIKYSIRMIKEKL